MPVLFAYISTADQILVLKLNWADKADFQKVVSIVVNQVHYTFLSGIETLWFDCREIWCPELFLAIDILVCLAL